MQTENPVRLHNPAQKKARSNSRRSNPAWKPTVLGIAGPIIAGGFLATFVVQGKQWVQAKTGWDARAMAFAELVAVAVGAWGTIWALKQPWGKRYRVEVLVGATALLTPLAVDAAATFMPERSGGSPETSEGRRHYRGADWYAGDYAKQGHAPMLDGVTTDVRYSGLTQNVEFGAARPRAVYN